MGTEGTQWKGRPALWAVGGILPFPPTATARSELLTLSSA